MARKNTALLARDDDDNAGLADPPQLSTGAPVSESTAQTLAAIGRQTRKVRQARSMTLKDVSDSSGISVSMLSLVERGRVAPSIGSLIVLADALGVTISDLLADQPSGRDEVVVREADQKVITQASHVVNRLVLDDQKHEVSIGVVDFPANGESSRAPHSHTGHEYVFVLDGRLTAEVNDSSYDIRKGDLISYSSRTPHRIRNPGRRPARAVWFNLRTG